MALAWKVSWEQSLKGSNPLSSAKSLKLINAVAVGFEPTEDISIFTRFRGVYLWPLRHTTKEKIITLLNF
jgi:hypothetical protein